MNVLQIIDSISMWPDSVTNAASSRSELTSYICISVPKIAQDVTVRIWLSLSYRIIRAFEVMVALIIQENIDDFMIEGDNVALMVERVSAIHMAESFCI